VRSRLVSYGSVAASDLVATSKDNTYAGASPLIYTGLPHSFWDTIES
jgi:hypothetical protein